MGKVAKLVWFDFGVRVVVNDNATDEEIYETAMKKVHKEGLNDLCMNHILDAEDDTECPYDPKEDLE